MKICLINGTNHKGTTYRIARRLADKLGGEITEFFLPKDFGKFCMGCTLCFMKDEKLCPHYKKLIPITIAVDEADVLILSSPVYVYHCTAAMKAWLDHYGWRWIVHRPEEKMFSKKAVVISTAAGAGTKSTNKDMADSLFFWGIPKVYKLGFAVHATSPKNVSSETKKKIEAKTDRLAKKIKASKFKPNANLKAKILFSVFRRLNKGGLSSADGKYWRKKGWTETKRPWK